MNIKQEKDKYYYQEGFWRKDKEVEELDYNKNPYPWPTERIDIEWYDKPHFIHKLTTLQNYLRQQNRVIKNKTEFECTFSKFKHFNLGNEIYCLNGLRWRQDLIHYIIHHQVKPTYDFINRIFMSNIPKDKTTMKVPNRIISKDGLQHLKITTNQLMILDALMEHGGMKKKYHDVENVDISRYSEHAGLLDFDNKTLEKIVVSGRTTRVDNYDKDIYLPTNIVSAKDYEYIFHTHPPTPYPGGRAQIGILFEFPSISDIFHFIEHYEAGITQGSIVITPEGLYNIRKKDFNGEELVIDEKLFFSDAKKAYQAVQKHAIKKYGVKFTVEEFHGRIAKDLTFIKELNQMLNKYDINIDYYPRKKDRRGNWLIRTLYLPVFPFEPSDMNLYE